MNYAEMSGYEINNRLHNAIACEGKYDLKVEGYKVTWTEKETGRVIETLHKQYDKEFKDYLSSWADAGPIIEKENISLTCRQSRVEWAAIFNRHCMSVNQNPLRAAMECFLMKKEREDAA